ncbi:MAG: septum site-determining protein Ssd [Nakamurella sp.]
MGEQPLIITDDDRLLDDLLRIAAAAGVEPSHARVPRSRAQWGSASLVLLDGALAPWAVDARLPRRAGVVVVSAAAPDAELWELCVRLGVDRTLVPAGSEEILIGLLSDASTSGIGDGRCVAVLGACGGAGASVFASAVAAAAAQTATDALLIDCDPWGAGLDVLLGMENDPGLRWGDLAAPSGRLQADALHRSLPVLRSGSGQVAVLCPGRRGGEIGVDVLDVVVDAGRRSGATTVLDVPRTPGPPGDRALEHADLVVLLAPADVRSCWAADRLGSRIRESGSPAGVVVRGPSPGGLGATELADVIGLPLLAAMRPESGLARNLEFGLAFGTGRRRPLLKAARAVLAAVEAKP